MAEEEVVETPEVSEWAQGIEDTDVQAFAGKYETQQALMDAVGFKAPDPEKVEIDWREAITEEDSKKFAESSTDINHLVKRAMDMRQKLSTAIVKPGANATDDDVVAFNKAMGIPGTPEEYEFPSVPEMTDEIKASQAEWGKRFHQLGISKEAAVALIEAVNKDGLEHNAAVVAADKVYAEKQTEALKAEWKGEDYDVNLKFANRAFEDLANRAGLNVEALRQIETKDGRFLMDRPELVKMLAAVGREMAEGTLGPAMTDSETESVQEAIADLGKQIAEAQDVNDSRLADQLYQKQLKLWEKMGDSPLVGAQGRVA